MLQMETSDKLFAELQHFNHLPELSVLVDASSSILDSGNLITPLGFAHLHVCTEGTSFHLYGCVCFSLRVKIQIKSPGPTQKVVPPLRSPLQKQATPWRVSTADRAPPVRVGSQSSQDGTESAKSKQPKEQKQNEQEALD